MKSEKAYFLDYIYTAVCSIPVCELDDVRKVGDQLKEIEVFPFQKSTFCDIMT